LNTVAAIKQGDEFIFQQVFHEYHQKLYFYVLHKTNSRYLAEEATQLAFIKLWKFRGHLDDGVELSPQLFRIAKTTLIDLLRKQVLDNKLLGKLSVKKVVPATPEAVEKVDEKELNEKILLAIREMPQARRRVFEMSRLQGKSYKEIAAELAVSVKTVENHISLAIKQLRHFF
jgi:RNA polymerase sigma-70 factor (family 1)